MAEKATLGNRLRLARRRRAWNQEDLARTAGVGVATVRRAEGGQFEPRLETARRLAAALGVRVAWLAVGEEPMLETKEARDAGEG